MRSMWKGSISFGLVSIPVQLFSATEEKDIGFHQVHEDDGGRVKYQRVCSIDGEVLQWSDIAKGYERDDGTTVIVTDEDLDTLPIPTKKVVEVLAFVPAEQIPAVAMSKPYYAEPNGDAKPYVLLRDALVEEGRVAVVKVALRQRERIAVLSEMDGVLVMQTMLWPDEVRSPSMIKVPDVDVRANELKMALSFMETLAGDFDPDEYTDDYRAALQKLLDAKEGGRKLEVVETPEDGGQVIDLMAALRASIDAAKAGRAAKPATAKRAAKKSAPAKKTGAAKKAVAKKAAPAKTTTAGKKAVAKKAAPARKTATPEKVAARSAPRRKSA